MNAEPPPRYETESQPLVGYENKAYYLSPGQSHHHHHHQHHQHQQQQQPAVIFVPSGSLHHQHLIKHESYVGTMVLACCVLWFCNVIFGLIAFVLAVVADNAVDPLRARRHGRVSVIMSVTGIAVTVFIITIVILVNINNWSATAENRRYVSPSTCCQLIGYIYPATGSYCYSGVTSSSSMTSCLNKGYFWYSSSSTCYMYSSLLTASLCCSSTETSYDNYYCHK